MPQFDISTFPSQIFWLAIVFAVMYLIIAKFVVPKAETIFKNRAELIDNYITNASELVLRSEKLKKEYTLELQRVNEAMSIIKQESIKKSERLTLEAQSQLKNELELNYQTTAIEIEKYYTSFRETKKELSIDLASIITSKITKKTPDVNLLNQSYGRIK